LLGLARVQQTEHARHLGDDATGTPAGRAVIAQRNAPSALREARAVRREDERSVRVAGRPTAEELGEEDLTRRRAEQVRAAHHLADPHREVVDDDGELIRVDAVAAIQDEVADAPVDVLPDRTLEPIDELDAALRHREAQRRRSPPRPLREAEAPAEPGIAGAFLRGVRRARDAGDLGARTITKIKPTLLAEEAKSALVERRPLGLPVGTVDSLAAGTLVPVETEP